VKRTNLKGGEELQNTNRKIKHIEELAKLLEEHQGDEGQQVVAVVLDYISLAQSGVHRGVEAD